MAGSVSSIFITDTKNATGIMRMTSNPGGGVDVSYWTTAGATWIPTFPIFPYTEAGLNSANFTYRWRIADVAPAATCTDLITLSGSATKTVTITKIEVSGDATAASILDVYLTKRTTANTGGTSTNPTNISLADSNGPAQTAALTLYSANPSALGTGTPMEGRHVILPNASTPASNDIAIWAWGNRGDMAPVLRGINEFIAVNLNGNAVPTGGNLYISIEWNES